MLQSRPNTYYATMPIFLSKYAHYGRDSRLVVTGLPVLILSPYIGKVISSLLSLGFSIMIDYSLSAAELVPLGWVVGVL